MAEKQTEKEINPASVDDQGFINIDYYFTAATDIINRAAADKGLDPQHITSNQALSLYIRVYKALFRPERTAQCNPQCNIPYNPENISRLIKLYIHLCIEYNSLPSINALEYLTGIDQGTYDSYLVTPVASLIRKYRKDYIQNRLNDSTIGVIALANNDTDTGLCYTRQNYIAAEAVKKSLSFEDLKQIAQRRVDDQ